MSLGLYTRSATSDHGLEMGHAERHSDQGPPRSWGRGRLSRAHRPLRPPTSTEESPSPGLLGLSLQPHPQRSPGRWAWPFTSPSMPHSIHEPWPSKPTLPPGCPVLIDGTTNHQVPQNPGPPPPKSGQFYPLSRRISSKCYLPDPDHDLCTETRKAQPVGQRVTGQVCPPLT